MKTPTMTQRSSALSFGITPPATESTTARATAACAGPNICTACFAPLIVTLLNRSVSGLAGRFGATTARSVVKPSLLFVSAAEGGPGRPRLGADDQIDVRDLVAVANQGLAEKKVRHVDQLPSVRVNRGLSSARVYITS